MGRVELEAALIEAREAADKLTKENEALHESLDSVCGYCQDRCVCEGRAGA
jgi:hypothetical protein